ncbi:MAG TPA: hypothetical protein VMX74_00185 [Pirellulales bacterium]|nr:hypothetical protein [Pirellulales bacterium]
MVISHIELSSSRSGTDATDRSSTAELKYTIWGSNSLDAIRDYLTQEGIVPLFYDGLVYKSITWEPKGGETWEFTAGYVHPDRKDENEDLDVGDYTFSFDGTGGTTTRFVSLSQTKYAKDNETASDHKGAINVTDDGVEGVEIGIQSLKFSIRKRMPRTTITMAYVKLLSNMAYTWNESAFLGFEAGELLFVGATGSAGTDSDPEVTYNFIASPNATDIPVGDITVSTKRGHDYLWATFEKIEDDTAKTTPQQPLAAYVDQVYYSSDFSNLGI